MKAPAYPFCQDAFNDPSAEAVEMRPLLLELVAAILKRTYDQQAAALPAYRAVQKLDAPVQARLAVAAGLALHHEQDRAFRPETPKLPDDWRLSGALGDLLASLLRAALPLTEADYLRILRGPEATAEPLVPTHLLPLTQLLNSLGKLAKKQGHLVPELMGLLRQLANAFAGHQPRIAAKLLDLLAAAGESPTELPIFSPSDALGRHLSTWVAGLTSAQAATWLPLLRQWQQASASQPSAKFEQALADALAALGPDTLREALRPLLATLAARRPMPEVLLPNTSHSHERLTYLDQRTVPVARGLLWSLRPVLDAGLLALIAELLPHCYQVLPGQGVAAVGLGNTAMQVLAGAGLPGVATLVRVRPTIRHAGALGRLDELLAEAARQAGLTPDEVEDLAIPDFGLSQGSTETTLGDYTATLALVAGKAELRWAKDNKPLKSVPAALKANHPTEVKALQARLKELQQTYTAQRDRLDRSLRTGRRLAWPYFAERYLGHGLLRELVQPLIWRIHHPDGTHHDALCLDNEWRAASGQPVPAPTEVDFLALWHPVQAQADVLAWRALLDGKELRQPIRQAFREVYLLTPPEAAIRTYSNRFAAHILRQHQFNSLTKLRGWRYGLLGAYDKGYDTATADLELPGLGLRAEFWVSEVSAPDSWNATGIFHYVSTDQVRFVRGLDQVVPLPEVPAVVFSEVMRDVDLFVGVASVGNDPQWRDNGGLPQYRDYWESYSFGELSEVAKTRHLALERLLPRLKIGQVSELTERFLRVRGHRHVYKIHLGSGNILMEPNDQYLCIVPDRSAPDPTANLFLPFEGDAVLSIILSKAQLLMHDDKITDATILRQL